MTTRINKRRIDAEKAEEMYKQGALVQEIASTLSCSPAYVYQLVRERGAKRIDKAKWNELKARALKLFIQNADMDAKEIAETLGVHYSTVCRWVRNAARAEIHAPEVNEVKPVEAEVKSIEEYSDSVDEEKEVEEW